MSGGIRGQAEGSSLLHSPLEVRQGLEGEVVAARAAHRCVFAHDACDFFFFVILLEWERSAVLIDSYSQLSNYGFFKWAWLLYFTQLWVSGTQKDAEDVE